jgi:hypothetical protein
MGLKEGDIMAVSKWPQVRDNLDLVKKWARDGIREKDMSTMLRIAYSTFSEYKLKYSELRDALKEGKQPFIAQLENNLIKRANGFEYEETKTYVRIEGDKEVKYQEKTRKYSPPDVAANYILLKNKDKDDNGRAKWSDNPAKIELERELTAIKKQVEELKLF